MLDRVIRFCVFFAPTKCRVRLGVSLLLGEIIRPLPPVNYDHAMARAHNLF